MNSPQHQLAHLSMLDAFALTVRFLLELAALGALGWWGVRTGDTALTKIALGAGLILTSGPRPAAQPQRQHLLKAVINGLHSL